MPKLAGHTTAEAADWLTGQRRAGHRYPGECLILQRSAREIPALAPTAAAARVMTPSSERVTHLDSWRRGMVGYSQGSNPAGHIFFVLGRRKGFALSDPNGILTESNDVVSGSPGAIGIVPLSFYPAHWNHKIMFAATWLNGYDFADFNAKPKAVHPTLGANYEAAIEALQKSVRAHAKDSDQRLHDLLVRDLARMKARYERFGK